MAQTNKNGDFLNCYFHQIIIFVCVFYMKNRTSSLDGDENGLICAWPKITTCWTRGKTINGMMKSLNMYIRWDTRLRGNLYTNYTKQVNSASNKYFCATTSKSQTVLHHCYSSVWFVWIRHLASKDDCISLIKIHKNKTDINKQYFTQSLVMLELMNFMNVVW